jgi:hypothetical protein
MDNKDGVYISMCEEEYHSIDRLSCSAMKDLMLNPSVFWHRSWMNPDRQKYRKFSKAFSFGRAYHTAILEPEKFDENYCCEYIKDDCVHRLDTSMEVGNRLSELGKPKKKQGEDAYQQALRLQDEEEKEDPFYRGRILTLEKHKHKEETQGKNVLTLEEFDMIARHRSYISENDNLNFLFDDFLPEISILWTCQETGVKMKARLDCLSPDHICDIKTFSMMRPIGNKRKIASSQIMDHNYHLQVFTYIEAMRHFKQGLINCIDTTTPWHKTFFNSIRDNYLSNPSGDNEPFYFLFCEKSLIENIFVYEFPVLKTSIVSNVHSDVYSLAEQSYIKCLRDYKQLSDHYDNRPWKDMFIKVEGYCDDFPAYYFV